jgi:hypothetical protein
MTTMILALGVSLALAGPYQTTPEQQVRSFVDAFNARNVEAMLAVAADDIQRLSVDGARVSTETEGKETLRASMSKYFQQ